MISRIETINDIEIWLESLKMVGKKNVNFPELTPEQCATLTATQDILSELDTHKETWKKCCKCMWIWPETKEWFDWNGQGRTGLHADCKFCRNSYQKNRKKKEKPYRLKHPYSTDSKDRSKTFGLTFEQAKRTQEAGKG